MTLEPSSKSTLDRFQALGSNLILGLLVTVLSVFTAYTNYSTYKTNGEVAELEKEGSRLLAESNTEFLSSTQFIIQDYTLYDGYFIQAGLDDFASEYYLQNFSPELQASIERGDPFDDQYYQDMYTYSTELFDNAFAKFDLAGILGERESTFQLAMLIAAIGLAFAAYASLLDEKNHLRTLFAALSVIMLGLSILQFIQA